MHTRSRISEVLAVGVVFAVAACQGSFSLNSKLGGRSTTPSSNQEGSEAAPQAQAEQGSSGSSGSSESSTPPSVATAQTGTSSGGGGGSGLVNSLGAMQAETRGCRPPASVSRQIGK